MALQYPDGKRFAFTIIDDTDVATVANVRPVYDLLAALGMRTTKTVWPLSCPEGSRNFATSETLEDPEYLQFARDLAARGFELTWHCATMESSERSRTIAALERFREIFGAYPRIHANHASNAENIYWGHARFDDPLLRAAARRLIAQPGEGYAGHDEASPFWWGDLCRAHFDYVRNLTFDEINLLRVNPSMPYHDEARPLVRMWFSASDAEDADAFCELLQSSAQQRLQDEGGVCIVATHLGKQFTREGRVDARVQRCLEELAARPGWFPTVGELLDWMRAQRRSAALPRAEWRRMQWRWARDLMQRKWRAHRARKVA